MTGGETIQMSTLPKTWIFDLDGTIVKHNGYKDEGYDTLLPGVKDYISSISCEDCIIVLTSRKSEYREKTESFLKEEGIRYDMIIFDVPVGERVLINDRKTSGIDMAFAVNFDRDMPVLPNITREL